ncbi:ArsR/SmtB family transcription factor [Lysinimonas soli]|uniref:ArsR/SmtB family transcription factor n=1 Tax=Lysinimonas soli TaxID=1074233 RepID=A0ABW0NLZ5_9MICO
MPDDTLPMPPAAELRLAELMRALSDQNRVRIVVALADGEFHSITDDFFGLDLHKSTVSHHLKTLREAGFTETLYAGRSCQVRLRVPELNARFPGLVAALTSPSAIADVTGNVPAR